MHNKNVHRKGYDLGKLVKSHPDLEPHVIEAHGKQTIDFSRSDSVRELNRALLKLHYGLSFWHIPQNYLCPPIPSRVDYIHHLAELIQDEKITSSIRVLDIGVGASCIYPLLGNSVYGWQFVGSEINTVSIDSARKNSVGNQLTNSIEIRHQKDPNHILNGIIQDDEQFTATMCNPPFFKNEEEATQASLRKLKGLNLDKVTEQRNFGGSESELWYKGGEKAFLHNYLYQSTDYKYQVKWFTSLVSKNEHVKGLKDSHKKLEGTDFKVISITTGNKKMRVVAWNFK